MRVRIWTESTIISHSETTILRPDRLLDLIFEKFTTLTQSPLIGQPCDELRPGLRRFPVRKYVIYYSVDDEGIWIERVLHGARDPGLQFGGNGS